MKSMEYMLLKSVYVYCNICGKAVLSMYLFIMVKPTDLKGVCDS